MSTETKSATELFDRYAGFGGKPESAQFRAVVDLLVQFMLREKIAPDEIRDAAFVASVQFASLRPARQMIYERDDLNWPDPS